MKAGIALACLIAAIFAGTHLATLRPPRCEWCGIAHHDVHAAPHRAGGVVPAR